MSETFAEYRDPASLKPYPGNPRNNDAAVDAVAASLREFGFQQAIVVDEDGVIVCGHTRWKAATKLGLKSVPVRVAAGLTPAQVKAYRLADNQTGSIAEWVDAELRREIEELGAMDFDISSLGFDDARLAEIAADPVGEVVEDEVPEPPVDPITKPGDLWILGEHRVLCGDSTKAEDVARLMGGEKAGMMVTDPPYGVSYDGGQANNKKREKLSGDDTAEVFSAGLSAALTAVPSGAWYIWHAGRYAEPVYAAIRNCGFDVRALIIWNKLKAHYGAPSAHYCQKHEPCLYAVKDSAGFCGPSNEVTVWDIEQPHRNEHHPTQKPVICMARAIKNHEAQSVYDPFLGSGTTLIAAEQLGRKCYGMEISPQYCDVIVKRWETLTGKKAERQNA